MSKAIVLHDGMKLVGMPDRTFDILSRVLSINESIVKALSIPTVVQTDQALSVEARINIRRQLEDALDGVTK